jgi:hypothetical protein
MSEMMVPISTRARTSNAKSGDAVSKAQNQAFSEAVAWARKSGIELEAGAKMKPLVGGVVAMPEKGTNRFVGYYPETAKQREFKEKLNERGLKISARDAYVAYAVNLLGRMAKEPDSFKSGEWKDQTEAVSALLAQEISALWIDFGNRETDFQWQGEAMELLLIYLGLCNAYANPKAGGDLTQIMAMMDCRFNDIGRKVDATGALVAKQAEATTRIDRNAQESRDMLPNIVDAANGNMQAAIQHYSKNVKAGLSKEARLICDTMIETGNKVRWTSRILTQQGFPNMSPQNVSRILKKEIDPKFPRNNPFERMHGKGEVHPGFISKKAGKRHKPKESDHIPDEGENADPFFNGEDDDDSDEKAQMMDK